ncbi:hypothetical protein EJB05_14298, partial [Eragrostis curvula]
MAEMVGTALAQEVVSRAVSFVLGNIEKASQDHKAHKAERLEIAVSELEFALERTGKLPITDLSLLHRRKMFKRAYIEGTGLLNKHKQKLCKARLNTDNVRRIEWFADHACRGVETVLEYCFEDHKLRGSQVT